MSPYLEFGGMNGWVPLERAKSTRTGGEAAGQGDQAGLASAPALVTGSPQVLPADRWGPQGKRASGGEKAMGPAQEDGLQGRKDSRQSVWYG